MKILKNIFLFSITFLGFIKFLCAKESHFIQSRDDFFPRCFVTKNNFHNLPAPSKFHTNNNLLKKSNKNIFAIGQRMIFEGYIVDENCVPVQNAVVKIWQKNNYGRYYDGFPKNKINGDAFEIQKNLSSEENKMLDQFKNLHALIKKDLNPTSSRRSGPISENLLS
jgi:hypothetical protein